jgi:3-hydroxyisobutyrate dehydrogenase
MIAWLGTGLLGANFVRAIRRRGEPVQVWNRTASKAAVLAEVGAVVCSTAADAVRGASRIHLTLSDDAAVDAVLEAVRAAIEPGAIIIDHTTTSPAGTLERARRWEERGIEFQHAPVFMAPANALQSTGLMLASGDRARFQRLEPELAKLTGRLIFQGDEPDRAAKFKLFGNLFLMHMTNGLIEVLKLAKASGVDSNDIQPLFEAFNPATFLIARLQRIIAADYANPSWELAMARKDARLMLEAADAGGMPLAVLPALAEEMDRFIAQGLGQHDWCVIARDAVQKD